MTERTFTPLGGESGWPREPPRQDRPMSADPSGW